MQKKRKWRTTVYSCAAFALCAGFVLGGIKTGNAAALAQQLQEPATSSGDALADKSSLEQQQEQTRQESEALQNARKELQETLDSMNLELVDVSNELNDLLEEIALTETAIEETKEALAKSEADAKEQYDSMKLRIQYMYENGGTFSWVSIFSAKSFTDALNRAEYAIQLANTDRALLKQYKNTLQQVETEKRALEEKHAELLLANEQLDVKKSTLLASIGTAQSDIADTDAEIAEHEAAMADIADQLAAMEEYERRLEEERAKEAAEEQARVKAEEEQKAAEEAARKEEEERKKAEEEQKAAEETAQQENAADTGSTISSTDNALRYYLHTTTPVSVSEEEEALFAALVYCEAGGESYETQFAVASVVVNRINSSRYPNSLIDVIYQKNQFSPASSGRLAVVLERGLATESCWKAAREALAGSICGDWLNFNYNFGTIDGLVIGTEVFYEL